MLKNLLFLLPLIAVAYGNDAVVVQPRLSDEHNIDICDEALALTPLLATNIYEPEIPNGKVTRTIYYPESGIAQDVITCLKVTNMDSSNNGGYPRIISGGVGSTHTRILLISQLNGTLNFRLEIWAE